MNKNKQIKKFYISVLGAGSWGGTIAWLLSQTIDNLTIWTNIKSEYDYLIKKRTLIRPLKVKLNKNIKITTNLKDSVSKCNLIIIAVPTKVFKSVILKLKKLNIKNNIIILSATKGITQNEYLRPSQIIKKYLPNNNYAVLSGPNIAKDVISKSPIISIIASKNIKVARLLQQIISSNNFRIYINNDVIGVELAGALKNVIAVAAGMSDGFGFNISTKAGLISRGLIEIARIVSKEGGKAKTLLGGAGIGDLIATCCSTNSRNYRVGYELAKGKNLSSIVKELGQIAEGIETVKAMIKLARKHNVNVPIANGIYKIVTKKIKPISVLNELLKRPAREYEIDF